MKFVYFLLSLLFLPPLLDAAPNELTGEEKEQGFQLIFDGTGFDGWEQKGNWVIQEDGSMFRNEKGGSIRFKEFPVPDDFELRFEWKVGEKSNSGIYYRPTQYEYQILANGQHPDGKNPRTSAASLYFGVAPSRDATKPPGEWNTGRIVGKGTVIQHWLNGEKVISFDYTDPAYAEHVELLKLRGGDLTKRGAFLSLQDHGDPVWYRTIRIRELQPNDEIDPGFVKPASLTKEQAEAERKKLEGILKRRAAQEAKKKQ
ncbi:MAG: DUF1080 domain-containing protein [Verrucomicrobiales bacterium]|jgi:hypothetical protein|nr:DUF1080 domain-containing protein [Verrucomicrobiales bacterium]